MDRRRVIFVMGVQRSGTNALFKSLERGAKHAFNEAEDSPLRLPPAPRPRHTLSR